jgi:adenine-specific DNA-methyltransferase
MNKTDLIQKVKALDGLTQDERAYLINLVNTKKKYGLVWEDKPEAVEDDLRENLPVLKEVKEKAIINGGGSLSEAEVPNHILIEGDNLHALTALTFTHEGKIDVIYIDPPYNTGEKDFKYNDSYIDKENGFRHSMWLSFISKRMKIIKRLLSNTGVLLVHIDENEFDALSLLLETEIFKEQDCLGYIIWNKKNPKGDAKEVATMHEYIICFAKNKSDFLSLEGTLSREKPNAIEIIKKAKTLYSKIGKEVIPDDVKEVIAPFNFSKEILNDFKVKYDLALVNKEFDAWLKRQSDFSEGEKAYKFIDENGDVFQTVSMAWPNKEQAPEDYFIPINHPLNRKPCPVPERGWRNPSSTMKKLLGDKEPIILPNNMVIHGEITFTINSKGENNQPRRKYLLKENMYENTPSIFNYGASDDTFFRSIGLEFPYAKPAEVAKYLLNSIHPNPGIILDCFAGSGTTLHAVLELNKKDNKGRVGIIVTNNEVDSKTEKLLLKKGVKKGSEEYEKEGICRKITYPRISRVIQGYQDVEGNIVEGLTNNNLRYYKSEFVSREPSLKNKRQLTHLATELLCIKEDCYTEQPVAIPKARLFANSRVTLLILFDDDVIPQAVELIKSMEAPEIKVYVFSVGADPYTEDFMEVADKVTLCALPDAIYKAYHHVLPKKQRAPVMQEEVLQQEVAQDLFSDLVDEENN